MAVPSAAVGHLGRHPPSQRIHCGARAVQSDPRGGGGLLGSFSTLLPCILNHTTHPPIPPPHPRPPRLHKRNNGSWKRRRGGGGEAAAYFPVVPKEGGGCVPREEGEVCSLHLLIAASGLVILALSSSPLDAALRSFLGSLFHPVIFPLFAGTKARARFVPPRRCWLCLTSAESSCPI